MNNLQEEMLAKKLAYEASQIQTQGHCADSTSGLIGNPMPSRVGIRERVNAQLHRAQQESNRASRLHELAYLLEKNPEIARILDLVEEVRG